jgi:ABC-type Na+ efflux pump permease subunit
MILPPTVERELRVALRKRNPMSQRLRAAAAGLGISGFFMLFGLLGAMPRWGRSLHLYLFLGGLYFAVVRPAQACIGLFSEERRNETLELLYLTGMTSVELFTGKLLGGFLIASCELLALVPFLALPFLAGGVSMDLFLATAVCLPLLLCFTIAVTVLASVVCKDDGTTFVFTIALAGFLSLATPLPFGLGKALTGAPPFSEGWLWLSPAYAGLLVGTGFSAGRPAAFWPSAAFTALWAVLCLSLAAVFLARTWRREPDTARLTGFWPSHFFLLREDEARRAALRLRILDTNAFQWLAQRERRSVLSAWAGIAIVCLVWLAGWWAWPRYWPSTVNFFITAMLLIITVNTLRLHAMARRIGEDRRDGMLELLLTTPLSPAEIVSGQLAAVRSQFRPVRWTLFGLCLLMAWGGWLTRHWNVTGLVSYGLVWSLFLVWSVSPREDSALLTMWVALNTGRPTFAVVRAQGRASGWSWLWILFNLKQALSGWGRSAFHFPSGSTAELVIVAPIVSFILLAALLGKATRSSIRSQIIGHMRLLAQQPVPDPDDPRLKKWKDIRGPMPG